MLKMVSSSFYNTLIDKEESIPKTTMLEIDRIRKKNIFFGLKFILPKQFKIIFHSPLKSFICIASIQILYYIPTYLSTLFSYSLLSFFFVYCDAIIHPPNRLTKRQTRVIIRKM